MSPPALVSTPALAAAGDPLARLRPWPRVIGDLPGAPASPAIERREGESEEDFENRIGTSLMALYRDTRRPDCFEALYAFARPSVLHWIRSLLHRRLAHLDPAELLQDTFVNVYRYPSAFREEHPGSFRVWVRTIAGNIVRRASASRSRLSFQELPEGLQEPVDRSETPAQLALRDEQERRLGIAWVLFLCHYAEAWKELSQRDRRTLHLVEIEGLSYREAGDILGVGRSNMKMIVFRSRRRIARRMRQRMNACLFRPRPELGAA